MGCDGGTIPRRDELVKLKKKPEPIDKTSHLIFVWRYCNLSQQFLQRPVVACGLGKLYNKSSVIEAIINKDTPSHIKSLKDTIELNLTPNPEFKDTSQISPYICPVTGKEMSGSCRFVALWSCGCVFSENALKEIEMETCPKCFRVFGKDDVVVLNPETDEVPELKRKIQVRKRQRKRGCSNSSVEVVPKKLK